LNQATTAKQTRVTKVQPETTPTNLRTKSESFKGQQRENYVRQSELQSRIGVTIEDKKYNRGASITPNIAASGQGEMFNSKNLGRSIAMSNHNS